MIRFKPWMRWRKARWLKQGHPGRYHYKRRFWFEEALTPEEDALARAYWREYVMEPIAGEGY